MSETASKPNPANEHPDMYVTIRLDLERRAEAKRIREANEEIQRRMKG